MKGADLHPTLAADQIQAATISTTLVASLWVTCPKIPMTSSMAQQMPARTMTMVRRPIRSVVKVKTMTKKHFDADWQRSRVSI